MRFGQLNRLVYFYVKQIKETELELAKCIAEGDQDTEEKAYTEELKQYVALAKEDLEEVYKEMGKVLEAANNGLQETEVKIDLSDMKEPVFFAEERYQEAKKRLEN